ncbi:PAS domain S-box protein [Halomicroarcula sp. F13]|uniref:histidine kinase n=1 Tax=Haloarcula rubra TaxID=2487747 RepID=A0AAW4PVF5_9EURY|nr:PAS domain S-box protein [Halomicroarcula rubra]MBX0324480.1 PAS domain S-box protein [Halomicroarcula rubra]
MSEQFVVLHVRPATVADGVTSLSLSAGPAAEVTSVTSRDAALDTAAAVDPDVVVCEHVPGAGLDGLAVLDALTDRHPDVPVLLCTPDPDGSVAAEATRRGATEYVPRSETDPVERIRAVRTGRDGPERETDDTDAAAPSLPNDLSASFDAIAGSVSDAIVTIDADSTVVYANEYLSDLTGYDRSELVGEPFVKLIPEHLRSAHEAGVARYLDTGEKSLDWDYLELPLVDADGTELTVSVSFGDFERGGEWYCTGVIRNISERKAREQRLAETNQRLDLALDGTDTGVYEWDLGTGDIVWDEATAALFDTTPEAFGGTVEDFYRYVHPDDREALEDAFEAARERGEQYEAEFRTLVDGETRWIHTDGVVEERDAQAPRLVAIATDISEQKKRERELQTNNEALRELTRLATRDDLTNAETIDAVLELGAERLDMPVGYMNRIDDEDYEVVQVVGDSDVIEAGLTTELANTYCKRIVETGETLSILDAPAEGWAGEPAYEMSGFACYFGGGIHVDGELYGTLCFADEEPRSEPFSEGQRTFVELLVEWVSRELERRLREDELERYEDIIEAVDDGVYALDDEGNFEFVNGAMTDLTGYDEDALLGTYTGAVKNDESVERAESVIREMLFGDRDDEATFDLDIQRADGTSFPAEDHMTLLYGEDDAFVGSAGVIRDVTDRVERERELREARQRIQQILDRIGEAFFAVDDTWELTYWNHRAEEVLGRDAETVMGENLWEMFPETVGSTFYEAYHEAMETQAPVSFEEYYPPVERWFRVNAYPSENGLSVYFHDITDQKERDAKLSGLLETTRSLMQAHTAEAVAETVVEAARAQLGFDLNLVRLHDPETDTLQPVVGSSSLPERPVYDADEAFPGEAFQRGETVRVDDFAEVGEYDNRHAEAAMYVPIGDHGVLSVAAAETNNFDDADVSVAEILASNAAAALDRVEREEDLLRYETAVENVRDMVYVLDEEGTFQLVTEPLADWLGFDREEMFGQHPRSVLDDHSVAAFEQGIRDLRQQTDDGSIQLETSLVTADGVERPAEIEVSLIDDDVFRGTVGVVRDLTELKQAREELRDERDRFSYLFNNLPDAVVETEFTGDRQAVRSVNPAFTEVFGFDHAAVLDRELTDLIVPPDEAARLEADRLAEANATGESVQAEIRRRTDHGFRDFLYRGIPYQRDDGRMWGFGIYTDITEQKERERRLEVLNRVLRHNLRNDLTVVMGLADELAERLDDETRLSLVERLQRKAADVASVSDRARDIERAVRRDDAGTKPVDVPDAVASLVDTYEAEYGGHIETTIPSVEASAADGRFTRVVGELLENSLEYAGPDPAITVAVDVTADRVSVTVADDGPGIPEHELDVVTGDEPITQLSHGSGLGLWLVIWVTESYGGTVTFGESATGGTSVTLDLPRTDV